MKQNEFARIMAQLTERREPFAAATVVKTEGSTIGKPGFKVIISGQGEILYGSLGGACPESALVPVAEKALATGAPRTVKIFLEDVESAVKGVVTSQTDDEIHVETNCGGNMEVYVEPYPAQQRLVIVGQGGKDDVEDATVRLGKMMDFEVVVIDHSPVLSEEPDQLIADPDFKLEKFKFYETDSVLVLTKGLRDAETLTALADKKLRYVGMMASRQRAKEDIDELRRAGAPEAFLASVRTPVGLDMGAVTPAEIALSIVADVVSVKHGKSLPSKKLEGRSPSLTSG
jgi:xanthine dehydrogenase accessory factor